MLTELSTSAKVVGAKQTRRAIENGKAVKVFLAADADPRITEPLALLAKEKGVAVEQSGAMKELGKACSLVVGAAVATIVRE
ncbi:MAG: ribosomal L7Ae/L30e/S12e/Gadd45 family protein [Oscillospiraceae bacterium]|nr:ribosomal L7Ae/L30e/S12e/Gadd45 family protein [Oscillospiraceae bacterium]